VSGSTLKKHRNNKRKRRPRSYGLPPPETMGGRVLITPRETASRLGVHTATLYRWLRSNPEFPRPIRVSENVTAYYEDEVARYIETRPRIQFPPHAAA